MEGLSVGKLVQVIFQSQVKSSVVLPGVRDASGEVVGTNVVGGDVGGDVESDVGSDVGSEGSVAVVDTAVEVVVVLVPGSSGTASETLDTWMG